jgi:hypothetical protein
MLKVNLNPVKEAIPVENMPKSWQILSSQNFHSDLMDRAGRFLALAQRDGYFEQAYSILDEVGKGFLNPFDSTKYEIKLQDSSQEFKINGLKAIQSLSDEFGDRISSVVWHSLAFMYVRENPTEEESILSQIKYLDLPWYLVDTVWHSVGKVWRLKDHIDSTIFKYTGMVADHNCDCNHVAQKPDSGEKSIFLAKDRHVMATNALFSHLLSESKLLVVDGMPFNLGLSPEVKETIEFQKNFFGSKAS